MPIDYSIKKHCVKMADSGKTSREIYDEYYHSLFPNTTLEGFKRTLRKWKNLKFADRDILNSGTFGGFTAHGATVQVDSNGSLVQAWVKQNAEEDKHQWDEIKKHIDTKTKPYRVAPVVIIPQKRMLEGPLFDMHVGIADYEYYRPTQANLIDLISSRIWDEINLCFGQDFLHNNDFRGHTAKGTQIEAVDMCKAYIDGEKFYDPIIECALSHSKKTNGVYTPGNHDECPSWMFAHNMKRYWPQMNVDDIFEYRKCIEWEGCFIGIGHCEYTDNDNDLFQDFILNFPVEFARSKVREAHLGHLHRESNMPNKRAKNPRPEAMDNGLMIRRLSSGGITDKWSDGKGLIGAHKRFQVFEWEPGRLASIDFV